MPCVILKQPQKADLVLSQVRLQRKVEDQDGWIVGMSLSRPSPFLQAVSTRPPVPAACQGTGPTQDLSILCEKGLSACFL
jgi:hypothetical protein